MRKKIRAFPRLRDCEHKGTRVHRDNSALILEKKKSFPNFSRQKPDHSTKCAAAPGEDDPDGAEKLLFYCEVLSDKDTRMREGGQ